jgi:hypothetical protein
LKDQRSDFDEVTVHHRVAISFLVNERCGLRGGETIGVFEHERAFTATG